jgi:hypothetical protein
MNSMRNPVGWAASAVATWALLFSDPVRWAATAVATWPRFWFMAILLMFLQFVPVYFALTSGWSPAATFAGFVAYIQLCFLYALRRLFLKLAPSPEVPS